MNKTELISAIAADSELNKAVVKQVLDKFLATVSKELKSGGKVSLVGHGTYHVIEKSARTGINPRTKEPIKIPAKKVVKFKPASAFIE
jgi:DNA-binding protein HU-beta